MQWNLSYEKLFGTELILTISKQFKILNNCNQNNNKIVLLLILFDFQWLQENFETNIV